MNGITIAQFAFATLLPVAACVALALLRRRPRVASLPERGWQAIVGVVFGLIAIFGTEAGIPVNGAMMNVRDAAPLAAGLFFGGPAGLIAGGIGCIERFLSVMWGVGEFTQVACSIATLFAGVYAAFLRKYLFNRHIPNLGLAFATGFVAEVLHLMLVLVTNPDQMEKAFQVAQACAVPMITCVGLSVMLCSLAMTLLNRKPLVTPVAERNVARILHSRMLVAVAIAFLITLGFTFVLQTGLSRSETSKLLNLNIEDVKQEIIDASDANLTAIARVAAEALPSAQSATSEQCSELATALDVAEINVVNADGVIVASTFPGFIGFDMASGAQSAMFLPLLPGGGATEIVQDYQPIAYDENTSRKYAGISIEGGFVQVGYDAANFHGDLAAQIETAVTNRHIGKTGVLAVIDESGNVISTYKGAVDIAVGTLPEDAAKAGPGEMFTTKFADTECYASYQEVEGYRINALLAVDEANASRNASVLVTAFMEVIVFAALFLVIYAAAKRVFVRGVREMSDQLGQITAGDLDVVLDVRTASELSSLSDDINQTVGVLKESLSLVQADLNMAASIQSNTLPDITSAIAARDEFELYATMEPAREVGGDFYDFFMVDDDHLALVVADVSGKGIPAALFMMQSKAVIKMEALSGLDPASVLSRANTDLSEKNDDDMFTTAWLGVLEISTGRLTYADAGHEKLALRRDGVWELPKKPNGSVALAAFNKEDYADLPDKIKYRNHTVELEPGDALLQYSDGVTEATDSQDELFGEDGLLDALNDAGNEAPEKLLQHVHERISSFVGKAPQFDDITMLSLRYKGIAGDDAAGKDDETR